MKNTKKYFLFLIALLVFLGFDKVDAAQWATKECNVKITYYNNVLRKDVEKDNTLYLLNINGSTKLVYKEVSWNESDLESNRTGYIDYNSTECPVKCYEKGLKSKTCEGSQASMRTYYYPSQEDWAVFADNSNVAGGSNETTITMISGSNSFKIYRYFKIGGTVAREESNFISNDQLIEVIMEIVESKRISEAASYLQSWANISSYSNYRTIPLFLNDTQVMRNLSTRFGHSFSNEDDLNSDIKKYNEFKSGIEKFILESEKYEIGSAEFNKFRNKYEQLINDGANEENCENISEITEFKEKVDNLSVDINNAHSQYNILTCGSSTCLDENIGTLNIFSLPQEFLDSDVNEIYANLTSGRTLEPSVKQLILDKLNNIKRLNSTYGADDIAFRNKLNGAFESIEETQSELSSWNFEEFKEACEEEVKRDEEVNNHLDFMSDVFNNNIEYNHIAIDQYDHSYSGSLERCEDIIGEDMKEFLQRIFDYVKILVPGALIAFGSFDFAKAVLTADADNMKKAQKTFLKRCIIAVAIFFIPTIVMMLLDMINSTAGTCGIK